MAQELPVSDSVLCCKFIPTLCNHCDNPLIKIRLDMAQLPWRKGKKDTQVKEIAARGHLTEAVHPEAIAVSYHRGHWAYGRYASGKALDAKITGARPDGEDIWWQKDKKAVANPATWSELAGVHPNRIIPNIPARVSGQFRSNDTVVSIAKA